MKETSIKYNDARNSVQGKIKMIEKTLNNSGMGGNALIRFYSYNWTQPHMTIDSVRLQIFHCFFRTIVTEVARADTAKERMLVPTIGKTVMLNRKHESLILSNPHLSS